MKELQNLKYSDRDDHNVAGNSAKTEEDNMKCKYNRNPIFR